MATPNFIQVKPVKLFYIGGFSNPNARITAMGKAYTVPEVGGYLEVEPYIANALIRRNRFKGMSVFTKDARFAQNVIANRQAPAQDEAPRFSREQLLEMLAQAEEELEEIKEQPAKRNSKKVEGE